MHIYGPPEVIARPDATLLAQAATDIYRAFPELRGMLLHSVLQRNEPTHTLFSVGAAEEHLGVVTRWPDLYAGGDWVAHPNPSMYLERAATTGILAAGELLKRRAMEPPPVLEHPRPEWLAGRMQAGLVGVRRALRRRAYRRS